MYNAFCQQRIILDFFFTVQYISFNSEDLQTGNVKKEQTFKIKHKLFCYLVIVSKITR